MNGESAAYYARQGSRLADAWSLLHPPYTAWNMSYVAIGTALAPSVDWPVLGLMLLTFFLGTGIAAHALDELQGRPLKTDFSDRTLKLLAGAALVSAALLGIVMVRFTSPAVLVIFGAGIFLVLAYNLEWWQGRFHSDIAFALSWGGFPVIAGFWTQAGTITPAAAATAGAATLLSLAQRSLSTPARFVRRKTDAGGALFKTGGADIKWQKKELLATWEKPLRLLSWSVILLAAGMLACRL
jgi:hypothetical protein